MIRCGDCGKALADQFELTWHHRDECPKTQVNLFDVIAEPVEMNAVGSPTGRVTSAPAAASVVAARRTNASSHRGIIRQEIRQAGSLTSREAARVLPLDRDGNPQNSNRAASRLGELWEAGEITVLREHGSCVLGRCHVHAKPSVIHLPMAKCDLHGRPLHRDAAAIWVAVGATEGRENG